MEERTIEIARRHAPRATMGVYGLLRSGLWARCWRNFAQSATCIARELGRQPRRRFEEKIRGSICRFGMNHDLVMMEAFPPAAELARILGPVVDFVKAKANAGERPVYEVRDKQPPDVYLLHQLRAALSPPSLLSRSEYFFCAQSNIRISRSSAKCSTFGPQHLRAARSNALSIIPIAISNVIKLPLASPVIFTLGKSDSSSDVSVLSCGRLSGCSIPACSAPS